MPRGNQQLRPRQHHCQGPQPLRTVAYALSTKRVFFAIDASTAHGQRLAPAESNRPAH